MVSLIYITLEKVRQLKYLVLPIVFAPFLAVAQETEELINPLAFDNFVDFLSAILAVVMVIAVPIIIFFLVYAGFLYVTAQGNSEQVSKATRALTYAIIGGLIILGAEALSVIIQNIVGEFSSD